MGERDAGPERHRDPAEVRAGEQVRVRDEGDGGDGGGPKEELHPLHRVQAGVRAGSRDEVPRGGGCPVRGPLRL